MLYIIVGVQAIGFLILFLLHKYYKNPVIPEPSIIKSLDSSKCNRCDKKAVRTYNKQPRCRYHSRNRNRNKT